MRILLTVVVEIESNNEEHISDDDLQSAAEQAVDRAMTRAQTEGWVCDIRDRVQIVYDYTEVEDTFNS